MLALDVREHVAHADVVAVDAVVTLFDLVTSAVRVDCWLGKRWDEVVGGAGAGVSKEAGGNQLLLLKPHSDSQQYMR